VSEAVLAARRQIYLFFRSRIDPGKLRGEVQLEPVLPQLPKDVVVDLLLRRSQKPWVAVCLIESSLNPDLRCNLRISIEKQGWLFRPAFLASRLKRTADNAAEFLLDTTQREFRLSSLYDLRSSEDWRGPGTLHFIDAPAQSWTTLRGLSLVHDPQVFESAFARNSAMSELLWSEAHGEWVHKGEAEALKAFREAEQARRHKEAEVRRRALTSPVATPGPVKPIIKVVPAVERVVVHLPEPDVQIQESEPLPAWMSEGLTCAGCGKQTMDWQNADIGKSVCVCRPCFKNGIRLPR
jgi:hypothetical protein